MRTSAQYSNVMVRMPMGADIEPLQNLVRSMGWTFYVALDDDEQPQPEPQLGKGLAAMRGLLKTSDSDELTFEEMRREALSDKFGMSL